MFIVSSPYSLSNSLSTFHNTYASGMKTVRFGSNSPFRTYLLPFPYTHHRVPELISNPLSPRQLDPSLPCACLADAATHPSGTQEKDTSVTVPLLIPVEKYLTFLRFRRPALSQYIRHFLITQLSAIKESALDNLSSGAWDLGQQSILRWNKAPEMK